MKQEKLNKVLDLVADSVDSGYSSVFTFAVKEILDSKERGEFADYLRSLATSQDPHWVSPVSPRQPTRI